MSLSDPIGDMIATTNNAQVRNHKKVSLPSSNFKVKIAEGHTEEISAAFKIADKADRGEAIHVIKDKIIVLDDFHFGGYAKSTNELREFISEINKINEMQIEEVYTGKALYALNNYMDKNVVKNKKVLFIHTGGIFTNKN